MNQVQQIVSRLGSGPQELDDIAATVMHELPELYTAKTWSRWRRFCAGQLGESPDGGVPWAASVDDHGTYQQLALMDPSELQFVAHRYWRQSEASRRKAEAVVSYCLDVHGVEIDASVAA